MAVGGTKGCKHETEIEHLQLRGKVFECSWYMDVVGLYWCCYEQEVCTKCGKTIRYMGEKGCTNKPK